MCVTECNAILKITELYKTPDEGPHAPPLKLCATDGQLHKNLSECSRIRTHRTPNPKS